ncbi:MAG TPA: hypothetical protein VGO37_07750 [Steroidobacteraceae bacterium]|jgi:hypothetical protein|nr:hypothetical protein [Steroidobacteraceae bacterium]
MPRLWRAAAYAALLAIFAGRTALAEHEHSSSEFEVFVATDALVGTGQPHPRDDYSWINADVIFGLTHGQFRVFGEDYITPEEHDLERLQLGYEVVPDTMLWLGRFHQPASAWNTEHHHGRYLQTSITRPSIENWEDEEGVIPQHITGALLETRRPLGSVSGVQFSGGAGASPALTEQGNVPINLVGNNPGKHGVSLSGRLAYLPEYIGTSSGGLLWARDEVFVRSSAYASLRSNHVGVDVYGAYADWYVDAWHLIGAAYYVNIELDRPNPDESFMSGYLQVERQFPHQLTPFARIEDSARMQHSRYVALFDQPGGNIDISLRRQAVGLRWDFARRQALSSEFARVLSLTQHEHAYEMRLQWSAAIP